MRTKTWRIGEWCQDGILQIENRKGIVIIITKDWDTKKECTKKVLSEDDYYAIDKYLNELTSCYYAGKVMEWIKLGQKTTATI